MAPRISRVEANKYGQSLCRETTLQRTVFPTRYIIVACYIIACNTFPIIHPYIEMARGSVSRHNRVYVSCSPSIFPRCLSIFATQEEQLIPVTFTTAFFLVESEPSLRTTTSDPPPLAGDDFLNWTLGSSCFPDLFCGEDGGVRDVHCDQQR